MPELFFPAQNFSLETLFEPGDKDSIEAFWGLNRRRGTCSTLTMNSPYCLAPAGPQDDLILHTHGGHAAEEPGPSDVRHRRLR